VPPAGRAQLRRVHQLRDGPAPCPRRGARSPRPGVEPAGCVPRGVEGGRPVAAIASDPSAWEQRGKCRIRPPGPPVAGDGGTGGGWDRRPARILEPRSGGLGRSPGPDSEAGRGPRRSSEARTSTSTSRRPWPWCRGAAARPSRRGPFTRRERAERRRSPGAGADRRWPGRSRSPSPGPSNRRPRPFIPVAGRTRGRQDGRPPPRGAHHGPLRYSDGHVLVEQTMDSGTSPVVNWDSARSLLEMVRYG